MGMKLLNRRLVLGLAVAVLASLQARADDTGFPSVKPGQEQSSAYVVYQSVALKPRYRGGMVGRLQILQDKRVTADYRQAAWGSSADQTFALAPDDPLLMILKKHPFLNSRLRLLGPGGKVIGEWQLDGSLATLDTLNLYGTGLPSYEITVDYGIGWGSYAGPGSSIVEIRGHRLVTVIHGLGSSLKNAWRIVPALQGRGAEIEQVQCHPDWEHPSSGDFVIEYTTYRFSGGTWLKQTRQASGYWEDDETWPLRSEFP